MLMFPNKMEVTSRSKRTSVRVSPIFFDNDNDFDHNYLKITRMMMSIVMVILKLLTKGGHLGPGDRIQK